MHASTFRSYDNSDLVDAAEAVEILFSNMEGKRHSARQVEETRRSIRETANHRFGEDEVSTTWLEIQDWKIDMYEAMMQTYARHGEGKTSWTVYWIESRHEKGGRMIVWRCLQPFAAIR
jgi:hypothetical protein